jgi:DNA polymerase elongation subunit (family B)
MKVRNLVISEGIKPEWNIAFSSRSTGKDLRKYPGAYVVPPKKGLYRDHRKVKAARKATQSTDATNLEIELNDENDRPCSGLDALSLYPNIIMTCNTSPEKIIPDEDVMQKMCNKIDPHTKQLYRFKYVEFYYGIKDEPDDQKELIRGWIVQHLPIFDTTGKNITTYAGMGIYPYILKRLFDLRVGIKKRMEYYNNPKEYLDKVFEYCKNNHIDLNSKSPVEQRALLSESMTKELAERIAIAAANPKDFYKMRVKSMEEIIHFLQVEYISRGAATKSQPASGMATATCESESLSDLFAEIVFYAGHYNTKQNGLKVYMNTFYGETGNSQSPFFIKQVAGAITTYGQKTLKLVKSYVESKGYSVKYGDTDSLYVSPPETSFARVDADYESGAISIQQYWITMVEITMEYLDILRNEVNEVLFKDNGTRFLRMAYEEVLWPYAFVGKKKYLGVQHQGIVNLRICMPECTLKEFISSKSLFLRGMEVKKRGSSELLKQLCYEVMKACFCITETRTMREIVEQKLHEITTRQFEPASFIKSAKYKLPAQGKPGNVSVLRFVARMAEIERDNPNLKIRPPEIGERFSYIIAECYPWSFDLRGRKSKLGVGDKLEFFESINNSDYCAMRATTAGTTAELKVDIDYYITNEIIGQFARFLTYHHDYDKFYTDDTDEGYKIADKKACDFAKKELRKYYKINHAKVWDDHSAAHKIAYKESHAAFQEATRIIYDDASIVLEVVNNAILDSDKKPSSSTSISSILQKELINSAHDLGVSLASDKDIIQIAKENHWDPYQLYRRYISGTDAIIPGRLKIIRADINDTLRHLNTILPKFEKVCDEHFGILKNALTRYKKISQPAEGDPTLLDLIQDKIPFCEEICEMSDIYYRLASLYKLQKECALIEEEIKYLKELKVGAKSAPPAVKNENLTAQFIDWLKVRNTTQ